MVREMSRKLECMPERSLGVPRNESSMQALGLSSGLTKEVLPVSRVMKSMFSPLSWMIPATVAMASAVMTLPRRVRMCRFFPWAWTQVSYWSGAMGVKVRLTPRLWAA